MAKTKGFFYLFIGAGAIITLALLATITFSAGLILAPQLNSVAQAAPATAAEETDALAIYENAMTGIYNAAIPSVVKIEVVQKAQTQQDQFQGFETNPLFPQMPQQQTPRQGQGSGFVWDNQGHIVTNNHVVEGADKVSVSFVDGTSVEATVVGTDPDSDLAVLKIDLPASQLKPLPLGDSNTLAVGQLTIALGNPFGQEFTMTSGIISAVGRTIRGGNSAYSIPEAIQTDAAINPGNSGGPLLNRRGEVIGINSQIISESGSSAGIGFAIPIDIARKVVPTLIEGKDFEYAWLGISGQSVTGDIAEVMDLPADTQGALVISLAQGGPADKAGLKGSDKILSVDGLEIPFGGDVITAINNTPVSGMDDLITYLLEKTQPGDKVDLSVMQKGGKTSTVTVTLGTRPAPQQ